MCSDGPCFFTCSFPVCETGAQDGLRGTQGGDNLLIGFNACWTLTSKDRACSPFAHVPVRAHSADHLPANLQWLRFSSCYLRRHSAAELGSVAPHAVQDDGDLAGERDPGPFGAGTFCDTHPPRLQSRWRAYPREQDVGRFVERPA